VAGAAALDKAFGLLDDIAAASTPLTAAQLQAESGLPRSTLHRLLAALEKRGLVRRAVRDRGWRPGFRLLELARAAWSGFDLRDAATEELGALPELTGETAQLAVLDGDACVVVDGAAGLQAIRHAAVLGQRTPWQASAPGLALVSFGDLPVRRSLLAALPAAEREAVAAAIEIARGRGYALGPAGAEGAVDVAAPVLDYRGQAAASLGVAGPRFRLDDTRLHALAPLLMAAARRVSHNAGGTAMSLTPAPRPGPPSRGVRCVSASAALLGEAPYWSPADQALWWVDMLAPRLHRHARAGDASAAAGSGTDADWPLDRLASAAVPRRRGGLVIARPDGLYACDAPGGPATLLSHPEAAAPDHRYNDAKCDARGRLWIGTLDPTGQPGRGSLFRVDADGGATRVDSGFTVANGLAFSTDGCTLWFADSGPRVVYAYDVDPVRGTVGNRRLFAQWEEGVKPDGLAADADGGVWVAVWDGWRVERYDAAGRRTRVVRLPVPRPTSLAFGGRRLETLYVTSARVRLDADSLAAAPLSGALFAVETGARGAPVGLFAG